MVSKNKLPLTIAANSVLMVSMFHGLARNFGLYACVHPVTKDSLLMGVSAEFLSELGLWHKIACR